MGRPSSTDRMAAAAIRRAASPSSSVAAGCAVPPDGVDERVQLAPERLLEAIPEPVFAEARRDLGTGGCLRPDDERDGLCAQNLDLAERPLHLPADVVAVAGEAAGLGEPARAPGERDKDAGMIEVALRLELGLDHAAGLGVDGNRLVPDQPTTGVVVVAHQVHQQAARIDAPARDPARISRAAEGGNRHANLAGLDGGASPEVRGVAATLETDLDK